MSMRTCPTCSSRVPTSNLRCFQCKQLLPSMLQPPVESDEPRQLHMPERPTTGPLKPPNFEPVAAGGIAGLFQKLARR